MKFVDLFIKSYLKNLDGMNYKLKLKYEIFGFKNLNIYHYLLQTKIIENKLKKYILLRLVS